ncbi:GroES-like protein [Athelia psychrophila]|uniref:GroES-like protein n=1 Tax=Athelia psychrophila TaxID=1759441 RepID=A0A166HSW0_9AGAM|nr:GroES-like protein [Fibularhizoctonia sp. CBS 109695]
MAIEGIPQTMLAAQLVQYDKPYEIREVPTPNSLSAHDMLIRVAVASLCHTDGMVTAGIFKTSLPCTASHEGAGTVAALGSNVNEFHIGDRVLCGLAYGRCGMCADCTGPEESTQYCTKSGEYVVVDAREANLLPGNLSFQSAAPLACAGTTIWSGIVRAELKPGEWLAIVGAGGGLGHLGVQMAKAQGLNVIGIDTRDEGLAFSTSCGAHTIDARNGKESVVAQVQALTGGAGVDATVNVSDANSAAGLSAAVTKMHGRMVQIAQPPEVSIPFAELVFRDVRVVGSLTSSRGEAQKMLQLVAKHNIKVHTVPFDGLAEIQKCVELAHSGKLVGKGVILIDKEAVENDEKSDNVTI